MASLCEAVHALPAIALDTEFVCTRIYHPQLGLIRPFDGKHLALTDLLGITDGSPLKVILHDPSTTKFPHAGSEDLEVFLNVFGELPRPLIDTQTLAAFCGHPMSWGFTSMVEEYSGVTPNKSESRTDRLARPLTERQCEHAATNVRYLLPITAKLMVETEASGRLPAALDECRLMQMRRREVVAPEDAWHDITNVWQLCICQLACLQLLADGRLRRARGRDPAVDLVVHEEHLGSVARYMPGSLGELDSPGLSGSEIRFHGKTSLTLAERAQALPEEALPQPTLNLINTPGYRKALRTIKSLITDVSETHKISAELLVSYRQTSQLLSWHWKPKPQNNLPELISGWRGELMAGVLYNLSQEYPQ